MDKYEYKLKLEQLQNLMAAGDYATASEMADTINWKKVRSSNTLCMVSDIYEKQRNMTPAGKCYCRHMIILRLEEIS